MAIINKANIQTGVHVHVLLPLKAIVSCHLVETIRCCDTSVGTLRVMAHTYKHQALVLVWYRYLGGPAGLKLQDFFFRKRKRAPLRLEYAESSLAECLFTLRGGILHSPFLGCVTINEARTS